MADGGGRFGVEPEALTDLAGTFERESGDLQRRAEAFGAAASGTPRAFGLLGACDGAAAKYRRLLTDTVDALGQLSRALAADARGLRSNAAEYLAADQAAVEALHSASHR